MGSTNNIYLIIIHFSCTGSCNIGESMSYKVQKLGFITRYKIIESLNLGVIFLAGYYSYSHIYNLIWALVFPLLSLLSKYLLIRNKVILKFFIHGGITGKQLNKIFDSVNMILENRNAE